MQISCRPYTARARTIYRFLSAASDVAARAEPRADQPVGYICGLGGAIETLGFSSLSLTGRRSRRSARPPLKWIHRAGDSFPVGISTVPATRILLSHGPKDAERR